MRALTDNGKITLVDLAELDIEHPHIAFVPQWDFLDFLTDAARELPHFELRMGAKIRAVIGWSLSVAGFVTRRGVSQTRKNSDGVIDRILDRTFCEVPAPAGCCTRSCLYAPTGEPDSGSADLATVDARA